MFSETVQDKYASNWPPAEDALAQEFVNFFDLGAIATLRDIEALCKTLEIEFVKASLPDSLRGYNCRYAGKSKIFVSNQHSFAGAEEHTALHELRELLEYEFKAAERPTTISKDIEELAEDFAVAVRVQALHRDVPKWFEGAATIERKWPRRLAYVALFVFTCLLIATITIGPQLEEFAEKQNRDKYQ